MKTTEWLNSKTGTPVEILESLKGELGIVYSINPMYPELYVLNYSQIDSPKTHPIVIECRSLVVAFVDEWVVVSRAFDRFLNYGESNNTPDVSKCIAHEKMDGSLISVFNWRDEWLYRTKKMIMPEGHIGDESLSSTWKEFIEEGLGDWQENFRTRPINATFIFEVVGPDNRVVVRYDDRKVYLLAVRHNISGAYMCVHGYPENTPRSYAFTSYAECVDAAQDLPELEEGYVLYDEDGIPVAKLKNPAYVAAHHLRGEGPLTARRVMDLLIMGEVDEYLSVFPEDERKMSPWLIAWDALWDDVDYAWETVNGVDDQKEFARYASGYKCKHILFRMRQGKTGREAFDGFFTKGKYCLIESYTNKDAV